MVWRVSGRDDRWFAYDGQQWTADPVTYVDCAPLVGTPIPMTPTGPVYEPTGPDDDVGLYLLAVRRLPAPLTFTGTRPQLPPGALG
jgi:hypothetical protein